MVAAWRDFFMKWLLHFLEISRKLQLRSRTKIFLRKANEQTFPTMYCPYGNIVNFPRTSRIHFYLKIRHLNQWEQTSQKTALPLWARGPPSNTSILDSPTHHPKRHPNPVSRFATIHFPDTQTHRRTDRPTHGISDRSIPRVLMIYYIDSERCANNTKARESRMGKATGCNCQTFAKTKTTYKLNIGRSSFKMSITLLPAARIR